MFISSTPRIFTDEHINLSQLSITINTEDDNLNS